MSASRHAAGHLRDDQPRRLKLRMMVAELGQHFCHLFRRGHSEIGADTAMQRLWIIEVENILGKISAIARSEVEMRPVRRCVEFLNQSLILLRGSLNLKTEDGSIVGRTD